MATSTQLANCGFFNSYGDDRLYDASDFSEYLKGILSNGCFPNDTGFLVKPNPAQILSNPPSVLISVGKVYYDGLWALNKAEFALNLGTTQVVGVFTHLLYFCFDTNEDGGRKVSIEYVAGTPTVPPVMPANGAGKFYLPLAIIANRVTANPIQADIVDTRAKAGVMGTTVGNASMVDDAVNARVLADDAVRRQHILDGEVLNEALGVDLDGAKLLANSVPISAFKEVLVLPDVRRTTTDSIKTEDEVGLGANRITYTPPTDTRMKIDCTVVIDGPSILNKCLIVVKLKKRTQTAAVWSAWSEIAYSKFTSQAQSSCTIPISATVDCVINQPTEIAAFVDAEEYVDVVGMRMTSVVGPR